MHEHLQRNLDLKVQTSKAKNLSPLLNEINCRSPETNVVKLMTEILM